MTKIYNPPIMQNIGPPVDPAEVKNLRKAFGLVHDEVLITGDYKELEQRLVELMNEFPQAGGCAMKTIHGLRGGLALCKMPGTPNEWPPGNVWVNADQLDSEHVKDAVKKGEAKTCTTCVEASS